LSRVLLPEGTAPSAHIPGIDIAGKTGSAQIVSLALRAKHQNNTDFAQNGWFVGFTPRRNPDIIVCVLFEGGEHGKLAARLATQVIKAYVDKQRRQPTKMAAGSGKVEIGSLWTDPGGADEDGTKDGANRDEDRLQGGRFLVDVAQKRAPLAVAAPGVH
jgi:penicillin-binding protein 2